MSLLENAVQQNEDGSWDVTCPITDGTCGKRATDTTPAEPWRSVGWNTKKVARARLDQHIENHRGTPMPELAEFHAEHGLMPHADGIHVVSLEDLS